VSGILTTKRGDTFRRTFHYKDSEGEIFDITGCTARFAAQSKSGGAIAFCAPTIGTVPGGTISVDAVTGTVEVVISAALMNSVEPGTYIADVELTFPNLEVLSSETFSVKVLSDVTR
jgi:hypothetical protein